MRSLILLAFLSIGLPPSPSQAQGRSQPSRAPIVTAESERWYVAGDPITYSSHVYYPSGAQIHFNANEMVHVGFYQGIPVYLRTTIEPYSVVFIPVRGGMMQPYERRRDGELAGTAGSTTPTLPTASTPDDTVEYSLQAPVAPTLVGTVPIQPDASVPVGTSGSSVDGPQISTRGTEQTSIVPSHTRIGPPPKGVNAIFFEFRGRRWYSTGLAIPLDPERMVSIGDHRGFTVYADRASPSTRLYLQIAAGGTMVAPYSINRNQE